MSQSQAYDDRDGYIYGRRVRAVAGHACALADTRAALRFGCFEGERAYNGVAQILQHSQRLHNSAKIMGFDIPFTVEQIEAAKKETLAKTGLDSAYVRAIAWRGSEMMGVSAQNNTIHLAIAVWPWGDYFQDKMKGIRMTHAQWRRPAPDTAPCNAKAAGLYMICTLSKHAAEKDGYADALMLDYRGQVAEATGANIFFVRDGAIHTPTPDCFLNGLTRQTVIGLAKDRQIEIIERAIMPDELATFSECFITWPAAEVNGFRDRYTYKPAELTGLMVDDYDKLVRGQPI